MKRALTTDQRELKQVRDAAAMHLSTWTDLKIAGGPFNIVDLIAELDATLATFATVAVAKAAWGQARAERTKALTHSRQQVANLKAYLLNALTKDDPRRAAFDIEPKTRRLLTAEQKTLKAARAALTRKARGTKGSRQKREITAEGQAGLMLVDADGTPIPGIVKGPKSPGK